MAITATTQAANRYGLNLKFWTLGTSTFTGDPIAEIDFANEIAVELSGESVWATGGQAHANKVAFVDPMEGTMTISTQLITPQLMAILAGEDMSTWTGTSVTFNNARENAFYTITGSTVWKDKDGVTHNENIIAYKASPNRSYNVTYTGEGDPSSMDIVFNLTEDDDHNVFKSEHVDAT